MSLYKRAKEKDVADLTLARTSGSTRGRNGVYMSVPVMWESSNNEACCLLVTHAAVQLDNLPQIGLPSSSMSTRDLVLIAPSPTRLATA